VRLFDGYIVINGCVIPTTLCLNAAQFAAQNSHTFDRETVELLEGDTAQETSGKNQELNV
jgi:hypothetical protein